MGLAAAGGLSAVGGIASGLIGANAATSAADTQANAAMYAANLQKSEFDTQQQNMAPFLQAGTDALPGLQKLVGGGLNSPLVKSLGQPFKQFGDLFPTGQSMMDWLSKTPGFQFTKTIGEQGTTNAAEAMGLGKSGSLLKGIDTFNTGLASNTFQQQFGNYLASQNQGFTQALSRANTALAPLQNLAGMGQATSTQQAQLAQQAVNSQNQLLTSGAAATAAGTVGSANALGGGINSATGGISQALILNQLLGGKPTGQFGDNTSVGWGAGNLA